MLSYLQEKLRRIYERFSLASNMEKEGYGFNKHETFDALMACYEKAASEYDEVNEIRQYLFQSAASLILRRSFRDRDEFVLTLMITYVVQFLAFNSILACKQCI